jgi:hypothetical protein
MPCALICYLQRLVANSNAIRSGFTLAGISGVPEKGPALPMMLVSKKSLLRLPLLPLVSLPLKQPPTLGAIERMDHQQAQRPASTQMAYEHITLG